MKTQKMKRIKGWASDIYKKGWDRRNFMPTSAIFVYYARPDKSPHWKRVEITYTLPKKKLSAKRKEK